METSRTITFCELCSQSIELFCWRLGSGACGRQLPFANRVHDFNSGNRTSGGPKGFEAEHGTHEPFHGAMVLLHEIIEILGVANDDSRLVRLIVVRYCCRVRTTFIDGDFLREPLGANGLAQERLGCVAIARGG